MSPRAAALLVGVGALHCCAKDAASEARWAAAAFSAIARDAGVTGLLVAPGSSPSRYTFRFTTRFAQVSDIVGELGRRAGCAAMWEMVTNHSDRRVVRVDVTGEASTAPAQSCLSWNRLAAGLDGVTRGIPHDCWVTRLEQAGGRLDLEGECVNVMDDELRAAFEGTRAFSAILPAPGDPARAGRRPFRLALVLSD